MVEDNINNKYHSWLCDKVKTPRSVLYSKLLNKLDTIDYFYMFLEDSNRDADGIDLRYRFGYENNYEDSLIASYIDIRPCSVLEMMVALALRCEESIMGDPDYGNRTGLWFWKMIENLGLSNMVDSVYNDIYVEKVIERFLNRKYDADGKGGLVVIPNCAFDLRKVEIWYQMMWYLNLFTTGQ